MADESTYVTPADLDDMDVDVIHRRMLNDLPINIDKAEGGFAYDMTRPSAREKSYAMEALNTVVQWIFPQYSSGWVLDMHAKRAGLTRKAAVPAGGTVHVVGTEAVLIPKGFIFCTPATEIVSNVNYEALDDYVLELDGDTGKYVADVAVECTEGGTIGNAPEGSITLMSNPLQGIESVTNPDPLTDGAEEETDEALKERISEHDKSNNVSHIGNDADYKRWATEVDGVGSASVIRESGGPGSGTVKVIILNANGGQASSALITAVYNHIMGTDDEPDTRLAPIGAILIVDTATAMTLNFAAEIKLDEDYTLETVTEKFEEALKEYLTEAKEDGEIRYTRVARCLSETPGVLDYHNLYINSARNNITVGVSDLPTITSLTLTEAEA